MPLAVEPVGICERCGFAVWLKLEHGRRSASCPCGATRIPETFFAAAGYGDAARTS
jgi:hypothetical protein